MTKKNTKPKLEINFKEETKKNEIRKVNPFPYYHDGRLEKFMDLFNELYRNFLIYCRSKGDPWEYVYCKILNVLGIEYSFKLPKEELPEYVPPSAEVNDENKEGEEEKKVEEKKEEKKEGEGEVKKEESKENEPKEGEVKEGEVKEGAVKEGAVGSRRIVCRSQVASSFLRTISPAPPSKSTLSGTTTAALPVAFRIVLMCWTKFNCLLLLVVQKS